MCVERNVMIFAGTAYRAVLLVSCWCHHCSWLACHSRRAVKESFDTGALLGKISLVYLIPEVFWWGFS